MDHRAELFYVDNIFEPFDMILSLFFRSLMPPRRGFHKMSPPFTKDQVLPSLAPVPAKLG